MIEFAQAGQQTLPLKQLLYICIAMARFASSALMFQLCHFALFFNFLHCSADEAVVKKNLCLHHLWLHTETCTAMHLNQSLVPRHHPATSCFPEVTFLCQVHNRPVRHVG